MRGLLIRSEPLDAILRGEKTWEIRGRRTHIRGKIALIRTGSGLIVGTCEIIDCIGPLSLPMMLRNVDRHGIPPAELRHGLPYKNTYAWVLRSARKMKRPVPYQHKNGIVVWHPLPKLSCLFENF